MSEQGLARRETDILPKLTDDAIASREYFTNFIFVNSRCFDDAGG